ncbi:MAG TPA: hypothetical protein VJJ98_12375 [Sedimentisphaerales bacterium]|nr:hypothetical protein [Sedimentisphaerales bacterium]
MKITCSNLLEAPSTEGIKYAGSKLKLLPQILGLAGRVDARTVQGGLSGNCDIKWEPGLYNNIADFNLDGNVNFADYAHFADTWLWQARL